MSAASKWYIAWLHSPLKVLNRLLDLAQTLNNLIKKSNPQTIYTFIEVTNFCFYKIGKNPEGKSIEGCSN